MCRSQAANGPLGDFVPTTVAKLFLEIEFER
jgi:hypothetical protein